MSDLDGVDASLLARDLDVRPYRQAFVVVLDRALSRRDVVALVQRGLERAPRFRQVVAGWPAPKWTDDVGFDVTGHVRETTLPAGQTLESWIEQRLGMPSDRDHPLWQLWLVRLPGERHVIVMFAHPSLASPAHLLDALMGASAAPGDQQATTSTPLAQVEALATGIGAMVDSAWRTMAGSAATFRVAGVDVAVDDVRRVALATGCSALDVGLTLIAEGFARVVPGSGDPTTLVPVAGLGRVVTLPVAVIDSYERLMQIASMADTWNVPDDGANAGAFHAAAARSVAGSAPHALLVTGVGGVADRARVGDARVDGVTVFTTPADGEEITVSITSGAARVFFGATAVQALDGFGSGVRDALAALLTRVQGRQTR